MPEVKPIAAIHYDFPRLGGDLSGVLAPPYDVLDEGDKKALLSKSARNIIAVDLPHLPPKTAGPVEVYEAAARRLACWLDDGTLIREREPALYLYHQCFRHDGQDYVRRMFIARVRLAPFSEGTILPHEKTFGGPKEDRLALMKATKCQLSPIFGLYRDPEGVIGHTLAAREAQTPDATGSLDGVENRLWVVRDGGVIDAVVSTMADRKIYIADGHHRYGTALLYRDFVAAQYGGSLPEDHPANYVMFVLAGMDDPGCLILPYNRALGGIDSEALLEAWTDGVEAVSPGEGADLVLFDGRSAKQTPVRFTNRAVLKTLEPGEVAPWYDLDYAYLHRYLIDELLTKRSGQNPSRGRSESASREQERFASRGRDEIQTCRESARPLDDGSRRHAGAPEVHYVKSVEDAKQSAKQTSGVALLTRATPMAHLRAMSEAGGLMPQKSTYFHPKLATGLTLNPLA